MGDTQVALAQRVVDVLPRTNVKRGVKVTKEDHFGDTLVIEDYDSDAQVQGGLEGKGKEIELEVRKKKAGEEDTEEWEEEEAVEGRFARDSHQFQTVQFTMPGTYCDHCGTIIWGITGKQGLKCEVCNYVCHTECEKKLAKRCRGYKAIIREEEDEGDAIKNVDKDVNFYDDLRNIGCHQFYPKAMARRTYCNYCRQAVNLIGKQGLRCSICRYAVHAGCAKNAERNCPIPYHVPGTRKEKGMKHHWIEGNIEAGGNCIYCAKSVSGGSGMTNFQCYWCLGLIHNECKDKHLQCDLGIHHNLKLPPCTFVRNEDDSDAHKWLVDISQMSDDDSKRPLCVLINRLSGAHQGASVIRQLSRLLNPMQLVDIAKGGPKFGIEMFRPLAKRPGSFCILACGGDGTVGWVCEELDKLEFPEEERPCICPLPIGTGNDLSRVLGWGPGYNNEDLSVILQDIAVAPTILLDRWKIRTYMSEQQLQSGKHQPTARGKRKASATKTTLKTSRTKSKSNTMFTRTLGRAIALSRGRGKGKGKGKGKDKAKTVELGKGRKGRARSAKEARVKKNKGTRGDAMDVYSDDEVERRRYSAIKAKQEEEETQKKKKKQATTTKPTNEQKNNNDDAEGKYGGRGKPTTPTPLTRKKAALNKTVSMPSIGSAFMDPKRDPDDSATTEDGELPEEEEIDDDALEGDGGKGKEKEKEKEADKEKEKAEPAAPTVDVEGQTLVAEKIYNNYFSVGVDAKVALDFHIARESNPENFKSRNYNKFKYFQYGAVSVLGGCKDLNKKMKVIVDGKEAKIPNSVEGVVALNLTSYASGTNPWKNNKPAQEWAEQRIDDGLLEVVGVNGTLHLGQIRTGLSTGVQLGQGKEVVFMLREPLPVQADGEPWLQMPATMVITLHNKTKMLRRVQAPSALAGMLSPTQWFKKGAKRNAAKAQNEFGSDDASSDDAAPISPRKAGVEKRKRTPSKKGRDQEGLEKDGEKGAKSN